VRGRSGCWRNRGAAVAGAERAAVVQTDLAAPTGGGPHAHLRCAWNARARGRGGGRSDGRGGGRGGGTGDGRGDDRCGRRRRTGRARGAARGSRDGCSRASARARFAVVTENRAPAMTTTNHSLAGSHFGFGQTCGAKVVSLVLSADDLETAAQADVVGFIQATRQRSLTFQAKFVVAERLGLHVAIQQRARARQSQSNKRRQGNAPGRSNGTKTPTDSLRRAAVDFHDAGLYCDGQNRARTSGPHNAIRFATGHPETRSEARVVRRPSAASPNRRSSQTSDLRPPLGRDP